MGRHSKLYKKTAAARRKRKTTAAIVEIFHSSSESEFSANFTSSENSYSIINSSDEESFEMDEIFNYGSSEGGDNVETESCQPKASGKSVSKCLSKAAIFRLMIAQQAERNNDNTQETKNSRKIQQTLHQFWMEAKSDDATADRLLELQESGENYQSMEAHAATAATLLQRKIDFYFSQMHGVPQKTAVALLQKVERPTRQGVKIRVKVKEHGIGRSKSGRLILEELKLSFNQEKCVGAKAAGSKAVSGGSKSVFGSAKSVSGSSKSVFGSAKSVSDGSKSVSGGSKAVSGGSKSGFGSAKSVSATFTLPVSDCIVDSDDDCGLDIKKISAADCVVIPDDDMDVVDTLNVLDELQQSELNLSFEEAHICHWYMIGGTLRKKGGQDGWEMTVLNSFPMHQCPLFLNEVQNIKAWVDFMTHTSHPFEDISFGRCPQQHDGNSCGAFAIESSLLFLCGYVSWPTHFTPEWGALPLRKHQKELTLLIHRSQQNPALSVSFDPYTLTNTEKGACSLQHESSQSNFKKAQVPISVLDTKMESDAKDLDCEMEPVADLSKLVPVYVKHPKRIINFHDSLRPAWTQVKLDHKYAKSDKTVTSNELIGLMIIRDVIERIWFKGLLRPIAYKETAVAYLPDSDKVMGPC
ncbi:hypothetical protein HDU80_000181 [Chytriomyces hyalinus]|nr:hypothetical protein HDU80_000181 [Chytriomyces hyalinus]